MIKLHEVMTKKDVDTFVSYLLSSYKKEPRIALWMADHIFGKAPLSIDHTTKGDKLPTPILSHVPSDDGA